MRPERAVVLHGVSSRVPPRARRRCSENGVFLLCDDKSRKLTIGPVLKPGKVALVTRGRFAGKKVVIVQPVDNGSKAHPFPHAVVAGVERYPLKVTRSMSQKRMQKRSKVKAFIKVINYNHLMPTRYALELESLKGVISADTFKEPSQREDAKKTIKSAFEDRYASGKNKWFCKCLFSREAYVPLSNGADRIRQSPHYDSRLVDSLPILAGTSESGEQAIRGGL